MLDYSQLEALLAVEETGTFEGAGRALNLSSFAVVQRIKSLETKMGVVLVERSPTRTSTAGRALCDHTREVRTLEGDVIEQHRQDCLDAGTGSPKLKIAVNDETLADWFLHVLDDMSRSSPLLDVTLAAHDQASEQMRSGEVVAALTCHKQTVYGFKTHTLGTMDYQAVASPAFAADHFTDGVTPATLSKAPALRFCGNDGLIHDWMDKIFGKVSQIPLYKYPSSQGSLQACLSGHAWAMHPAASIKDHLEHGRLVELIPNTAITRNLYWHVAGTMVDTVRPITNTFRQIAKSAG